jgi:hypothetical protein
VTDLPPTPSAPAVPDAAFLIAALRQGDEAARGDAYRRLYGSDLGRAVLVDMMKTAGVGRWRGTGPGAEERIYADGQHDFVVTTMGLAGFDPASAILATLTGVLEGQINGGPGDGTFGEFPDESEPEWEQ